MWWIIIFLILVGLTLLVLEILVIPGAGVVGIIGFGMMATGIWMAYTRLGLLAGNLILVGTLALSVLGIILSLRSKTWKNAMLKTEISGKVNEINHDNINVGDRGVAISRCAPMGKAMINDEFVEVSSMSEFVDQDTEIEIIRIQGNKVFIKQLKEKYYE